MEEETIHNGGGIVYWNDSFEICNFLTDLPLLLPILIPSHIIILLQSGKKEIQENFQVNLKLNMPNIFFRENLLKNFNRIISFISNYILINLKRISLYR